MRDDFDLPDFATAGVVRISGVVCNAVAADRTCTGLVGEQAKVLG
jgi:hypothetical protein